MKCTVCGAELPEGAAFCNDCGNPIRQGAPSPADAAPSAQSCPRCGAQARPEATFCPACGYRMKAAASPAQPAQPAPPVQPYTQPYAQPYPPQPAQPYAPPTQQPAPYPYVQPAQPYAQQPGYYAQQPGYYAQQPAARPAKKRKGALVAVIIVLLLAVIGAGTYFMFGKQIKRLVLGDKYAYALIEQKNLKDDFEKLVDAAARIGNLEERAAAGGHSIGLQADVDEAGLGLDAQTAAAIGGITLQDDLGIQWVSGKPVYYNALGLAVGDERLMTLQIYTEGDSILIGLPEVLDSYIRIDPAALAGATGGSVDAASATMLLDLVTSLDLAIDRGELENSLMEVTKILLDHIDETTFERGRELTVGSVTGTYDAYTVTLGSESAKAMVIGILEFARGDDALYNLIGRVMSLSEGGSYEPVDRAEYESRIDEAIADMESEEITDPFTMIHTAYVDSGENIVGREFRVEDEDGTEQVNVFWAHPADGADEAMALRVTSEGSEMMDFSSEFTRSGDLLTGTGVFTSEGSEVLSMSFEDYALVEKDGTDYAVGTCELMFPAEAGMPVGSIVMTGELDGGDYYLTLEVPGYIKLDIGYNRVPAGDVDIPDFSGITAVDVTDTAALEGLMTEDAMTRLMEIVSQLGLPLEGLPVAP